MLTVLCRWVGWVVHLLLLDWMLDWMLSRMLSRMLDRCKGNVGDWHCHVN